MGDPIYNKLLNQTLDILSQNALKANIKLPKSLKTVHMKALQYKAPDARLARHYDNDPGFVILYVNGPGMEKELQFEFKSGDVLVFNSSKKAQIYHGVDYVVDESAPKELKALKHVRICLQT